MAGQLRGVRFTIPWWWRPLVIAAAVVYRLGFRLDVDRFIAFAQRHVTVTPAKANRKPTERRCV